MDALPIICGTLCETDLKKKGKVETVEAEIS